MKVSRTKLIEATQFVPGRGNVWVPNLPPRHSPPVPPVPPVGSAQSRIRTRLIAQNPNINPNLAASMAREIRRKQLLTQIRAGTGEQADALKKLATNKEMLIGIGKTGRIVSNIVGPLAAVGGFIRNVIHAGRPDMEDEKPLALSALTALTTSPLDPQTGLPTSSPSPVTAITQTALGGRYRRAMNKYGVDPTARLSN